MMIPNSSSYDVWMHNSDPFIEVNVFLPNGLFIPLTVRKEATLLDIKEDAWEEAQRFPLYGVLHDKQTYVFTCVNQTTSEREEFHDEEKRLCDIRPFQAVLKLIERKGDKAEKILNSQIGLLIGKGLHEFDALKNPEVNDFRFKMRTFCQSIIEEKESKSHFEQLKYQYPVRADTSGNIPFYIMRHLEETEGKMVLEILFESSETSFKFFVHHSTTPKKLLESILEKQWNRYKYQDGTVDHYVLKVNGREEYLFEERPLILYKYVQQMICDELIPTLKMVPIRSIPVEADNPYMSIDDLQSPQLSSLNQLSLGKRKMVSVSAWSITETFLVSIDQAHRINAESDSRLAIEAGLYHGDELLCETVSTSDVGVSNGTCEWDENLQFEIKICDIPRMARLCLVLYEITKTNKNMKIRRRLGQDMYANPLAWVNTTVYDFKNHLKSGSFTFALWTYSEDPQMEDISMLNPLGTVVSNPDIDQAAVLTITFAKYDPFRPVRYPELDEILETAACQISQSGGLCYDNIRQASKSHLEQIRQISEKDLLYEIHEQEKELLWFLRQDCRDSVSESLPKLLKSLKWNEHNDVAQMQTLLQIWPPLPSEKALELLDYSYADMAVRKFAVKCLESISDEDLSLYLLQLVQALKYESYLENDLVKFLLSKALTNLNIGHQFFWLLRSEMQMPAVSVKFGLILEAYCRGAPEHMRSLIRQMEALSNLIFLNEQIQYEAYKKKESKEKLIVQLKDHLTKHYLLNTFQGLQCPLDPGHRFHQIKVEQCRIMDSKMKPMWLVFQNSDRYAKEVFVIFKRGDDLRQDMLALQMIRIMDKLWKEENLDFRMIPYNCLATDYKVGLIEVVLEANTIANIQKEKNLSATSAFKKGSLLAWLKDHNTEKTRYKKAIENFTLSCAGYCVATYVLGVADRHSDNIMVKKNGQLFHIDFGHILGRFKSKFGIRRERVPFVLTNDFVHVITRGHSQKSEEFSKFQSYCETAFMILRRKGPLILSLFAMMLSSGMPELTSAKDLDYLRETLVLDMSDADALRHFRSKFVEALNNSWKVSVNWFAHNIAKDNK